MVCVTITLPPEPWLDDDREQVRPGPVVATPAALEAIREGGQRPADFLDAHLQGDWGRARRRDRRLNDLALADGSRLLSAYTTLRGARIWIITEAAGDDGRRAATTLLLPSEY